MKAQIVLGLQFGDEGKGRTVDYLSSLDPNSIVIRFSGGQNCGHTVMKDGIKHVFGNYGSGTLRGIPSYFSEHCSIYLNTIDRERRTLLSKGIEPELYVHPLAKMTTPYDVAYNVLIEKKNQHGSCGVGIGTTMKRHNNTGYKLYASDLNHITIFLAKLQKIKEYYVNLIPPEQLGEFFRELSHSEEHFIDLVKDNLFEVMDYSFLMKWNNLIFEGSQGIMLDMDHGIFPNVTYANTTGKNAVEILKKFNITSAETYYVTRCYQTRHGNGWMSNEADLALINNEEEINVFNKHQGKFKIGELDYDILNYAFDVDKLYNPTKRNLVVTCLDQRPGFKLRTQDLNLYSHQPVLYFRSPENVSLSVV